MRKFDDFGSDVVIFISERGVGSCSDERRPGGGADSFKWEEDESFMEDVMAFEKEGREGMLQIVEWWIREIAKLVWWEKRSVKEEKKTGIVKVELVEAYISSKRLERTGDRQPQ